MTEANHFVEDERPGNEYKFNTYSREQTIICADILTNGDVATFWRRWGLARIRNVYYILAWEGGEGGGGV